MRGIKNYAKIAVIANCQARPIANFVKLLAPNVEIATVTVVQLTTDADTDKSLSMYETCDLIFSQLVYDSYPVAFVRLNNLKKHFGDKVISWPNIFFRGQCPDIRYLSSGGARVLGPLGEYQSIAVYDAWRKGIDTATAARELLRGGDWVDAFAEEAERSLAELENRERHLTIGTADYIKQNWRRVRFFHTFNHPANELLIRVAHDLLKSADMTASPPAVPTPYPEALDPFVPAVLPPLAEKLGLKFSTNAVTKGVAVSFDGKVTYDQRRAIYYDINSFITTSYRCFDAQLTPNSDIRIS